MVEPPRVPLLARALRAYGVDEARAYGRTAWLLTLGTLLLGTGRGVVAPFLVIFLVEERGLPLSVVGAGILVEFVVRALVGPVAGSVSDRRGRKPLMLVGLLATSLILPSYLLVRTPVEFMVLSVANGALAAHSLYGPAANALVVDVVPKERRGGVFGLIHASRNLGWTAGIAAGALLVRSGFWPVFVGGSLLPFAYFFVVLALVRDPPRPQAAARGSMFHDWGRLLRARPFMAYLVLSTVFFLGWGQVNSIFTLYLTDGLGLPRSAVGILAVNTVLVVALQIPFGRLADRAPRALLLAVAALLLEATYAAYALALPLASWAPAFAVVTLGLLLFTFAEMLYSPIQSAYAAELAPPGATGGALGIMAFAAAVGQGAPPILADLVVPHWGWPGVWLVLSAMCLPAALGLLALGRWQRRAEAPAEVAAAPA